jgi:hypothetical protein
MRWQTRGVGAGIFDAMLAVPRLTYPSAGMHLTPSGRR